MSRFLSKNAAALSPYVPGEQPRERQYIKLNTNECPYAPSPKVAQALAGLGGKECALYPDPTAAALRESIASAYGLSSDMVFAANGSDEVLAFCCLAFFDRGDDILFPDPSYGFYPVYAELFGLNAHPIPLAEDFTVKPEEYFGSCGHILIANPNAPTGLALPREEIERILSANAERLVIVDEAYVDFAEDVSALPLLESHDNLLITGTFSKSRSMAGMRLGYAFSSPEIIAALERIKYSFNPYNVNVATQLAGAAAVQDAEYLRHVTGMVKATRERASARLRELGLRVLPSSTNFIFVSHPGLSGKEFYVALREKGILVRCFEHPRTLDFVRVSIGSDDEMNAFLKAVEETI